MTPDLIFYLNKSIQIVYTKIYKCCGFLTDLAVNATLDAGRVELGLNMIFFLYI